MRILCKMGRRGWREENVVDGGDENALRGNPRFKPGNH
jgi:hypothetical protein